MINRIFIFIKNEENTMKINKIITFLILINSLNISSQETEYLENGNFLDPVTIYGNLLLLIILKQVKI